MSDLDDALSALEAQTQNLTTAERVWVDAIRARWDDPRGRAITSREWDRVRALTEEARQR